MPKLKGTEASLSYVQCFLYLVSSSINVSIFHIPRLDVFLTDLVCMVHIVYIGCLLYLKTFKKFWGEYYTDDQKIYEVCPEGIQPWTMKNGDIY